MSGLIEVARKYIRPYYYYIIAIVVLIVFLIAANYAYKTFYTKKQANLYKDVANANRRNKDVQIFFFHVDWCPHCKKALPEWTKFKSEFDGKEIHGYVVRCVDLNCTNEDAHITGAINRYNIDSYPTVKMLKDEDVIDFDSKISSSALEAFVNSML
jgi:thiol-disulfide isomerase/thioredoxin